MLRLYELFWTDGTCMCMLLLDLSIQAKIMAANDMALKRISIVAAFLCTSPMLPNDLPQKAGG
jgi:hypothetical protein